MYRGDRAEVDGDSPAVGIRETGGVPDDFGHGSTDKIKIRRLSVLQQDNDFLYAPFPDPSFRIGGDVGDSLAAGTSRGAGEQTSGRGGAEPVARRVGVAAAADCCDQIRATVPGRILRRVRLPWTGEVFGDDRYGGPGCRKRARAGRGGYFRYGPQNNEKRISNKPH